MELIPGCPGRELPRGSRQPTRLASACRPTLSVLEIATALRILLPQMLRNQEPAILVDGPGISPQLLQDPLLERSLVFRREAIVERVPGEFPVQRYELRESRL